MNSVQVRRIAILDHDASDLVPLAAPLALQLGQLGVGVDCVLFPTAAGLLESLEGGADFQMLLLDWTVPALEYIELVRLVRCELALSLPIVIVSVNANEREVAQVLHEGADDVVTPFRPLELAARVHRLLVPFPVSSRLTRTRWGPWTLDASGLRVHYAGVVDPIALSTAEFDLALALFRRLGQEVPHGVLLDMLQLPNNPVGLRALEGRIYRLRRKLDLKNKPGTRVQKVCGVGYKLDLDGRVASVSITATSDEVDGEQSHAASDRNATRIIKPY